MVHLKKALSKKGTKLQNGFSSRANKEVVSSRAATKKQVETFALVGLTVSLCALLARFGKS